MLQNVSILVFIGQNAFKLTKNVSNWYRVHTKMSNFSSNFHFWIMPICTTKDSLQIPSSDHSCKYLREKTDPTSFSIQSQSIKDLLIKNSRVSEWNHLHEMEKGNTERNNLRRQKLQTSLQKLSFKSSNRSKSRRLSKVPKTGFEIKEIQVLQQSACPLHLILKFLRFSLKPLILHFAPLHLAFIPEGRSDSGALCKQQNLRTQMYTYYFQLRHKICNIKCDHKSAVHSPTYGYQDFQQISCLFGQLRTYLPHLPSQIK
ncbi:hypothetical protein EGR_04025 [Echinococcus granulosus]|uniref:Uncharacterized protein n=1 Tax=Echinococcus granulosus TaxID=6210 RepID=W6US35_ECHGR|nr:hypothetical protein EGR_04025 [Echinococcus granulosus]EUB61177.1 hypothetical protein EGR_04025 [Echinococcus granulosus]